MSDRPFSYGGRRSGKTIALRLMLDEENAKRYRDLFEGQWPPTPQIVADCYRIHGDERAEQMVRQARRRSEAGAGSFEDCLDMLMREEAVRRMIERDQPSRFGDLPFAISLKGWP